MSRAYAALRKRRVMSKRSIAHTFQTIAILAGVLTLVSAAGGCSDKTKPPPGAMNDPILVENYPGVVALDGLQPYIGVSAPVIERGGGQPLKVTVPVRAMTNGAELNVQYRFLWLNPQQVPTQPEGDWRYVRMPARTQIFMSGNALDDRATDWRLEIRTAR